MKTTEVFEQKQYDNAPVTGEALSRPRVHSFSAILANKYGHQAAIVLAYIAHRVEISPMEHKDRKWFFSSLDEIASRYPYWSRSATHRILKRLQKSGAIAIDTFNRKKYDRTSWYTLKDWTIAGKVNVRRIRFVVEDASKYGLVEATLLHNVYHWLHENRADNPGYTWHHMSASILANLLPFAESSIRRALNHLAEVNGPLERRPAGDARDRAYEYRLKDERVLEALYNADQQPERDMDRSKWEMDHSKWDMHQPEWDMHQPKRDDYTYSVDISSKTPLEEGLSQRNTFIERPTQSSALSDCFSVSTPELPENCHERSSPVPDMPGGAGNMGKKESNRLQLNPKPETSPNGHQLHESNNGNNGTTFGIAGPLILEKAREYLNAKAITCQRPPSGLNSGIVTSTTTATTTSRPVVDSTSSPDNHSSAIPESPATKKPRLVSAANTLPSPAELIHITPEMESHIKYVQGLELDRKADLKRREEECRKRLKTRGSPDEDKEEDVTLPPEEKVRILRNGIKAVNRVGFQNLVDGHVKHDGITATEIGYKAANRFFQANSNVSARNVMDLLCECAERRLNKPHVDGYDEEWRVKRGSDLGFLLIHLEEIMAKMEYFGLFPDFVPLSKEELVG